MRGPDEQTQHMFSYLLPEQRVPADHPLRAIRALTDEALRSMSAQLARLYSTTGRPSIPPEQLLRALLLQVLYTVRSERLLMEELDYNLAVPVVRRVAHGRPGLAPDDVYEEPGPVAGRRSRRGLLRRDRPSGARDRNRCRAMHQVPAAATRLPAVRCQAEGWSSGWRCPTPVGSDPVAELAGEVPPVRNAPRSCCKRSGADRLLAASPRLFRIHFQLLIEHTREQVRGRHRPRNRPSRPPHESSPGPSKPRPFVPITSLRSCLPAVRARLVIDTAAGLRVSTQWISQRLSELLLGSAW